MAVEPLDWKLYNDQAGTSLFSGTLNLEHKTNFSDNPQDFVLYFMNKVGDPMDSGSLRLKDRVNPGVNPVKIKIVDSNPGNGHEASEIKLALAAGDLAAATGGADLELGLELISGVSNYIEIHIRVTNAVPTPGRSTELKLNILPTVTEG